MSRLEQLDEIMEEQKRTLRSGVLRETQARRERLKRLYCCIKHGEQELLDALKQDLGKSSSEGYSTELGMVYHEIREAVEKLPSWNRPRRGKAGIASFPSKGYRVPEPVGEVLIMSPWNYPVQLSLAPLVAAMAAGCPCVLKPSRYSEKVSLVLEKLLEEAFPLGEVAVFQGGSQENQLLLEKKWDTIFFTGSPAVGRVVMTAAAKHLTPVALELGGKSPVIVDETADLDLAARRIMWGKLLNSGQTCVAPDYLLVERSRADALVERLLEAVKKLYGPQPLQSPDYGRIINQKHFDRLTALLETSEQEGCRVLRVSEETWDAESRGIAPAIVTGVNWESAVMQEELFGPILPVIPYDDLDDTLETIMDRPTPLALYLFTRSRETARRVLREVPFGGGCVNDTVMHLTAPGLPFGGLGESGMGQYHGKAGFDVFTHYKSVLVSSPRVDMPMRYAPYGKYDKWIRRLMK